VDVRQLNVMDDDRISASSFDVVRRNADGTTSVIKCEVDRGRRLCSLMTCGESGRILERDYVQLHQNPLVLEWWGEERGERRHGPVKAQQLQAMLDVVIERLGCAKSSDDGASDSTEYASAGSHGRQLGPRHREALHQGHGLSAIGRQQERGRQELVVAAAGRGGGLEGLLGGVDFVLQAPSQGIGPVLAQL